MDRPFALFASLFALLALAGCGPEQTSALPPEGVIRLSEQFTGDFSLTGADGDTVTDQDFAGKVMLVYFGFTHCPDVCPGDVGVMSAALNELGPDAEKVAAVFISVDPERDTPDVLKDYLSFEPRIMGLSGEVEAVEAAWKAYKVFAQKVPMPESALEYTINHTRFFYVADRSGQPQYGVKGGVSPQELAAVLRRSISEKS